MEQAYISGQITNLPFEDAEYNFDRAAQLAAMAGYEVVNPLQVVCCDDTDCGDGAKLPDGSQMHHYQCYMRHDIIAMLGCETIIMLPNYKESKGAQFELEVARMCGLIVRVINDEYTAISMPKNGHV